MPHLYIYIFFLDTKTLWIQISARIAVLVRLLAHPSGLYKVLTHPYAFALALACTGVKCSTSHKCVKNSNKIGGTHKKSEIGGGHLLGEGAY